MRFTRDSYLSFFGNQFHLYAVQDLTVYRCTEDYTKALLPFAEALDRAMFFSHQNLPALSDCIRSLPENVLQLEAPENLLVSYAPDDCIGSYYLDYDSDNGLTAADVVIHYDPWWNQAAQDQAADRAHRIGQQHTVQVYKLIAKDTIEEKILKLQEKKAALLESVTDPGDTQPLTREVILELLR